jgi:hypothetical protein
VVACVVLCLTCAASAQTREGAEAAPGARWDAFVGQFLNNHFAMHPDSGVSAGRHEFDGQLPDFSAEGLRKDSERLKTDRERALAFNANELDERRRFERLHVIAVIDGSLFWLERSGAPYANPTYYADSIDPDVYVTREYAPLETRIKSFTQYARNVPRVLQQAKANLRTPMARTMVKIGRRTIGGLADFYTTDATTVFAPVKDQQLQRDFVDARDTAARAVREFDAWLAAQEPNATDEFMLGAEKFTVMLKMTEGVDVPLDELERIGQRDLERNRAALNDACAKLAPGKPVRECVALAAGRKSKNPDPVAAAAE